MILHQYYLQCLSHASYLIGDEQSGRAVVVDPQRDVSTYVDDAKAAGLSIELVIETHFHADFLSGHLELAARTGAEIAYGPGADAAFPIRNLSDGERIGLGDVELEVLATPGHTPESISVVVREHAGDDVPHAVLTGDTLFIGDVGRPDLLAGTGLSAEAMARQLYHSLHDKLLALPDATRVLPAHGAGSACGKNLSTATESTIGEQRRLNHALAAMTVDEFVSVVTDGQPATPLYFAYDARRNRERHALLDDGLRPDALSLRDALALQATGAVILDARDPSEFAAGHLPGSVNVGLQGRFAEYAGDVLRPGDTIVLVADDGAELEARVRLGRIGFDNVAGHLGEPIRAFLDHPDLLERSSRLTAGELARHLESLPDLVLIDVRALAELAAGTVPGARHIPLAGLLEALPALDAGRPTVVYCAGGYRSSIAASVLAAAGFADTSDLIGGFDAWRILSAGA